MRIWSPGSRIVATTLVLVIALPISGAAEDRHLPGTRPAAALVQWLGERIEIELTNGVRV
jgi:hypothetical protein